MASCLPGLGLLMISDREGEDPGDATGEAVGEGRAAQHCQRGAEEQQLGTFSAIKKVYGSRVFGVLGL